MPDETETVPTPAEKLTSPKPSPTISTASFSGTSQDDDLPGNIGTEEQLALLPEECLSGNKRRPLRHVTENGQEYTYALQPMFYSVIFILLVELLERFSFYGVNYTQTSFLTGVYNRDWNAGMSSVAASSYVSISTAVGKSLGNVLDLCGKSHLAPSYGFIVSLYNAILGSILGRFGAR
eukprot:scaffold721_cov131-Cylindrotheca_fusiformis.AAC.47